jgi:hypothetical protein
LRGVALLIPSEIVEDPNLAKESINVGMEIHTTPLMTTHTNERTCRSTEVACAENGCPMSPGKYVTAQR